MLRLRRGGREGEGGGSGRGLSEVDIIPLFYIYAHVYEFYIHVSLSEFVGLTIMGLND